VVQKSGSFFSFDGERLAQGRTNAKAHLDANPEIAKEIERRIYAKLDMTLPGEEAPAAKDAPVPTPA
jgi:recombination protein RecA